MASTSYLEALLNGSVTDDDIIFFTDTGVISTGQVAYGTPASTIDTMRADITRLKDAAPVAYDASTLSYDTATKTLEAFITDTSWDDADIIRARSTTTRPNATTINVYIQTLLVKAIVTRMAADGRLHHRLTVRVFPLSAQDLAAGVYVSAAGSVLSPTKSGDCYNATDSTNRLYYRIYHPATARTTARGMAFDVVIDILRRSTSTTAYADVIIRII